MSKLTKAQAKAHAAACDLLTKNVLSLDEREFVLEHWQESARHINSASGAFFTPLSLAWDFSMEVGGGTLIDLCAGIGALTHCVLQRDRYAPRKRIVCIEINPDYVAVGRKVVPEAEWICGDIFDLPGSVSGFAFDQAICNPPFGRSKNLPLPGITTDLNALYVASRLAPNGTFILPQMSCPFVYSGQPYYDRRDSAAWNKFHDKTGINVCCSSIDCSAYSDNWRGVSPTVEIVTYDLEEDRINREEEAKAVEPELTREERIARAIAARTAR